MALYRFLKLLLLDYALMGLAILILILTILIIVVGAFEWLGHNWDLSQFFQELNPPI